MNEKAHSRSPHGLPWVYPILSLGAVILLLFGYMLLEPHLEKLKFEARLEQPFLWLLFAAPAVHAAHAWGIWRRSAGLEVFGYDRARSAAWLGSLRRRRWRSATVLALALILLTAAAIQPRCNPEKTRFKTTARDIAILLDVSKSMLAEDIQPSRLERAKLELNDLAEAVKRKGSGDRLALVVFAGEAVIKCPLTSNYSYFKSVLKTITHRSAQQGGTRIGDAIRKALSDLLGQSAEAAPENGGAKAGETVLASELKGKKESYADILLVTDGGDMESFPVHAARAAAAAGVGIYAVGLGSEGGPGNEEGTLIPIRTASGQIEYLKKRDGEAVRSKLDSGTLQEIVNMSPRGRYLPVGTNDFDLADFFEKTIAEEAGREVEDEQIFWTEIFQPFLLAGLAFYLVHIALPVRPRKGRLERPETQEATP